jgi:hypothetical protein
MALPIDPAALAGSFSYRLPRALFNAMMFVNYYSLCEFLKSKES